VEWVEVTGKTVEEAKDVALDRLGVDEVDAEFEVLEEPKTGFLGRLKGEARVRARVRPTQARPKVERRDRKRRDGAKGEKSGNDGRQRKGSGKAATAVDEPAREDDAAATAAVATVEGPASGQTGTSGSGRRRSGRGGSRGERTSDRGAGNEGDEQVTVDVSLEDQARMAADFMTGLLDAFGLDGSVETVLVDEENAEVSVDGTELGLLVGPKGRTLAAIGDMARSVIVRQCDGVPAGRVHVDVAGYRHRRREALTRFTVQVAEQVRESGVRKALEPMSPADRKVVHDAVNDLPGVASRSEGDEPYRRVVIVPAED
jgi:spoIIIJ-associated protein